MFLFSIGLVEKVERISDKKETGTAIAIVASFANYFVFLLPI